MFEHMMKGSA